MNGEEVRLRSLLAIRTRDNKYIKDIPPIMQFAGLYPEKWGQSEEEKANDAKSLNELKERLDKELKQFKVMGYDNCFSLKIQGEVTKPVTFCPKCKVFAPGKFCSECGTMMEIIQQPVDKKEIIKELREWSDDCSYLLTEKGGTNEGGNGDQIEDDIQKFSNRYPNLIFQLDVDWDSGFDQDPSRYYYKNGKKKDAKAKVVYEDPKFD